MAAQSAAASCSRLPWPCSSGHVSCASVRMHGIRTSAPAGTFWFASAATAARSFSPVESTTVRQERRGRPLASFVMRSLPAWLAMA